jgi:uncharacterized protein
MESSSKQVACPTCGKPAEWRPENAYRPFCSQRCKLIDLGAWAEERFKFVAEHDEQDQGPKNL